MASQVNAKNLIDVETEGVAARIGDKIGMNREEVEAQIDQYRQNPNMPIDESFKQAMREVYNEIDPLGITKITMKAQQYGQDEDYINRQILVQVDGQVDFQRDFQAQIEEAAEAAEAEASKQKPEGTPLSQSSVTGHDILEEAKIAITKSMGAPNYDRAQSFLGKQSDAPGIQESLERQINKVAQSHGVALAPAEIEAIATSVITGEDLPMSMTPDEGRANFDNGDMSVDEPKATTSNALSDSGFTGQDILDDAKLSIAAGAGVGNFDELQEYLSENAENPEVQEAVISHIASVAEEFGIELTQEEMESIAISVLTGEDLPMYMKADGGRVDFDNSDVSIDGPEEAEINMNDFEPCDPNADPFAEMGQMSQAGISSSTCTIENSTQQETVTFKP